MGTNYYYHPSGEEICPHCRQETPNLHIGKSSFGWKFSLRVHPDEGIHVLDHWIARWEAGGLIVDEYGDVVAVGEMKNVILNRSHPNGLNSHVGLVDHGWRSPATYGGETYDLCNYEFS